MRLDFTGIQPILDSILPFSSCRGTKGATDKETFKIQSKPTRCFTIPKPHHNSIQAVEDPPARPTAIKITQTIRPTNRATTSLPTTRTILQQTKPLAHGVSQDGSDFLELRFFFCLDLMKGKGRIVGEVREREREARDVLRGERVFIFMFIIFTWIATIEPYI
jgi:hypothetical protein